MKRCQQSQFTGGRPATRAARRLLLCAAALAACLHAGAVLGQPIVIDKIDVPRTQQTPVAPSPITTFPIQPVPIAPATVAPAPVPNTPITLFPVAPVPIQPAYTPSAPVTQLPSLGTPGLNSGGSVSAPQPNGLTPPSTQPAAVDAPQTNAGPANSYSAETPQSAFNGSDTNSIEALIQMLRSTSTNSPSATPANTAPNQGQPADSPAQNPDPAAPPRVEFIYPA